MSRNDKTPRQSIAVKLCIWSIRHQTWLAGQIRIYIFSATALVAFLAFADVISIQTAMLSSFCGGAVVLGLIWTFIQNRKAMLLNIQDPHVRDQAHSAMLEYLSTVRHGAAIPTQYRKEQRDPDHKKCKNCHIMQ